MNKRKYVIVGLIAIASILFFASAVFFANKMHELRQLDSLELELMTKDQILTAISERQSGTPFFYYIPVFGFFGIIVGAVVYYIMSGNAERKEKILAHNTDIILHLLDPQERKVIRKIVEHGGRLHQIEITYMEGFTKVKAHRIIQSLVQKGILEKETLGKMRAIKMHPDLYQLLKK